MKDLYIESKNIIFGKVTFLLMKIPLNWVSHPIPGRTDVEGWVDYNNVRWVSSGYTSVVLTDYEGSFQYLLHIRVKRLIRNIDIKEYIKKDCKFPPIKEGEINGDYHKLYYVVFMKAWKKYIIFGDKLYEFVLKVYVYLKNTNRLLTLEFSCKKDLAVMLKRVFPLLSTIRCE